MSYRQLTNEEIQELRQQVSGAWMEQLSEDTPEGWSQSSIDISAMVAVFPALKIKPGYVLRAYQFRERNNGEGIVWAMPENATFPDPEDCDDDDPPHPPDALDDVMAAIEGDGSPESYFHASLLVRELAEFGAIGHGSNWVAYHILTGNPFTDRDRSSETSPEFIPTGTPDDWQWTEAEPLEWSPTVQVEDNLATVVFYTYCGLGSQAIIRFADTYKVGQYNCVITEQVIAEGSQGYVW